MPAKEPPTRNKVRYLRKVPLFAGLGPEDLGRLARIVRSRVCKEGERIIGEAEPGDTLFILVKGLVKIFRTSATGRARKTLAILRKGDCFGEMSLLDREVRSASAEALETSEMLYARRSDFANFVRRNPILSMRIIATLSSRLREADRQIGTLTFQNLMGRVIVCLIDMAEKHGVRKAGGIEIGLNLTHQELADMVGTAREVITRVLSRLRRTNAISIDGKRITILNMEKLRGWIY